MILEKYRKLLVIAIFLIVLVIGGVLVFKPRNKTPQTKALSSGSTVKSKATAKIDRSFEFDALNAKNNKKTIKFLLVNAEIKDEIQVKGKSRKSAVNKDYLLIRIELDNSSTEKLAFISSDFLRLEKNGKLYAPDFHNGRVISEPLSVKNDVVAFVVDAGTKKVSFLVGDLSGEKEKIEINL